MRKNVTAGLLMSVSLLLIICAIPGTLHAGDLNSERYKDTIHALEKVTLGGVEQTILITGTDTLANPILLLLHGGPGFSELRFFRSYNAGLDSSYTVVNWDQRGTGLSYNDQILPSTMTLDQLIEDGHQLITLLKKRFSKQKVFLAGHSWGSLLGISIAQRYPDDLYAYIGIGQVVSMRENEKTGLAYAVTMAEKAQDQEALRELRPLINRYPSTDTSGLNDLFLQRKWLMKFGGVVHGKQDYQDIFNGITAPENKLYNDSLNAVAELFSIGHLWPALLNADLFKSIPRLKVPAYFIAGRYDYNTNSLLVEKYYHYLAAPKKKLIWFEGSAHIIPFEEPIKFNKVLKDIKTDSSLH